MRGLFASNARAALKRWSTVASWAIESSSFLCLPNYHQKALLMSTPVSEIRHILIPQTSWSGTLFWYTTGLVRPIARIKRYFSPIPTPPKGPQVWGFPPPKALNRLINTGEGEQAVAEQWKHEPSGYTMTVVLPPPIPGQNKATTRIMLYFHGSAFQLPPYVPHICSNRSPTAKTTSSYPRCGL